jgi:hypothetical protein
VSLAVFGIASSFAMRGIDQNDTPWAGSFERINAYAYFAWLLVLAAVVIRRELGGKRHAPTGQVPVLSLCAQHRTSRDERT